MDFILKYPKWINMERRDVTPIESYWTSFFSSLPESSPYPMRKRTEEKWGEGAAMADELGGLIAQGTKTATCSALAEWEAEGEALPQVGDLTMVLSGSGEPLCIIEVAEVRIRKFNEVQADFAWEEGEGDRSLEHWREVHRFFFSRSLAKIGLGFDEDMMLVCERFHLVHGPGISNK
jgi:uncharacterized protein YhfF